MTDKFDRVFQQLEAPDYPATCDQCGAEGTNESLEGHECTITLPAPSNHSPLSWSVAEYESDYAKPEAESRFAIESNDGMTIAVLVGDVVDRLASQKVNAELIVHAVNAHTALVSALREARNQLDCNCISEHVETCVLGRVNKALRLAGEEN